MEEQNASSGNRFTDIIESKAIEQDTISINVSAKIEEEIANLSEEDEKKEFLQNLGLQESGLSRAIRAGYKILDLSTYFTAGPKETHAWTFKNGINAQQAAGIIHTDFEKGFICAECVSYDDYVKFNGEQGAKEAGKLRQEGKDYVVKDGDVMLFRFNISNNKK